MSKIIQQFRDGEWETIPGTRAGYGPEADCTPEEYVEKVSKLTLNPMRIITKKELEKSK